MFVPYYLIRFLYSCEKNWKLLTVQYYIDCVSWTYEQVGLTHMLLEGNLFVGRELTMPLNRAVSASVFNSAEV